MSASRDAVDSAQHPPRNRNERPKFLSYDEAKPHVALIDFVSRYGQLAEDDSQDE